LIELPYICGLTFLSSWWLTGRVRRTAIALGVMDVPNQRSSHSVPTPRGGGVAIVISSSMAYMVLAALGLLEFHWFMALVGGGLGVAVIGYLDDRSTVGVAARFAVHIGAAVWAASWVGGIEQIQLGDYVYSMPHMGYVITILAIVWVLNLFNFMDGIDGIAGAQSTFVALMGGAIAWVCGLQSSAIAASLVIAAASLGFLRWNWPPAKIFMGDAGSGYLGFVLAVLALGSSRESPKLMVTWLILGGLFFVDATVTLLRRLARGERVYQAHRSHAY
jgi:Fuc2NAc and GlcNAc transferase